MKLKRLLLALTAVGMFAAVMAGSASATMVPAYQWYTGSPTVTLPVGTSKTVTCSVGEHEGSSVITLTGTAGETATPVKLTAKKVECIGATIFNEGTTVLGKDKGKLKFTEVTVDEPSTCSVEGGTVETTELKTELAKEEGVTGKVFDKFEPAAGATGNFATVKLIGTGCPVTGNKLVKGVIYGEAVNAAGVASKTQPITFSPTISTTTGSSLTFAGNAASLTGRVVNVLSPELEFGAK